MPSENCECPASILAVSEWIMRCNAQTSSCAPKIATSVRLAPERILSPFSWNRKLTDEHGTGSSSCAMASSCLQSTNSCLSRKTESSVLLRVALKRAISADCLVAQPGQALSPRALGSSREVLGVMLSGLVAQEWQVARCSCGFGGGVSGRNEGGKGNLTELDNTCEAFLDGRAGGDTEPSGSGGRGKSADDGLPLAFKLVGTGGALGH
mmetsp:Transcript_107213/g.277399  ORF Transcript_107213/g.277399 Transcript_107213/m.277399 type:complete len:209 (+) Transcript_107213:33-659(+)